MKKQSKGTNGDLLEQLQAVIEKKQVILEAFLNTEMVEKYF